MSLRGKKWWDAGVRFECQGSGKCCSSRGEYGFVYLTIEDRRRMAAHLGLSTLQFTKRYCAKTGGHFHLKEDPQNPNCMFLNKNKCNVYEARPTQCRTWPFWPEVMKPKAWRRDVVAFCPGVGKGRVVASDEIKKQLDLQREADR